MLLEGESGTGKELFARSLHALSPRADAPFVAINCAAIPETLLETELFGHEKGAFTGAVARKPGKFEMAHRGTLFLDEIGDLPLALQAKILRALEERRFERVGGTASVQVDVRLVAATNRGLRAAVAARRFREDLFFRLSVFPITVPPLRERPGDIPLLARYFVDRFCRDMKKTADGAVAAGARSSCVAYRWPGNVRELQNCIERAVILAEGDSIQPRHLNLSFQMRRRQAEPPADPLGRARSDRARCRTSTRRALAEVERLKIEQALQDAERQQGPRRGAAADHLQGVPRRSSRNIGSTRPSSGSESGSRECLINPRPRHQLLGRHIRHRCRSRQSRSAARSAAARRSPSCRGAIGFDDLPRPADRPPAAAVPSAR